MNKLLEAISLQGKKHVFTGYCLIFQRGGVKTAVRCSPRSRSNAIFYCSSSALTSSSFTCRTVRWRNAHSRVTKEMKCASSTILCPPNVAQRDKRITGSRCTALRLVLSWRKHKSLQRWVAGPGPTKARGKVPQASAVVTLSAL